MRISHLRSRARARATTSKQAHAALALVCATVIACAGKDGAPADEPNDRADAEQIADPPASDAARPAGDAAEEAPDTTPPRADAAVPALDAGKDPLPADAGVTPSVDSGPDFGQDSANDTFLRTDTLVLKAPNLYLNPQTVLEINITADGQAIVDAALVKDDDKDGLLDLSLLLRFLKTADPKLGSGRATTGGGRCPAPVGSALPCGPDKTFPFQAPAPGYSNAQSCTLTGTQETAPGPCFLSEVASLTMQLPILGAVPLSDGQVIGSWDGANIRNGRVRGFLARTVAAATKLGPGLPPEYALLGVKTGAPLTDFLADREMQKNGKGENGWWFLVNYTAKPATFDPTK